MNCSSHDVDRVNALRFCKQIKKLLLQSNKILHLEEIRRFEGTLNILEGKSHLQGLDNYVSEIRRLLHNRIAQIGEGFQSNTPSEQPIVPNIMKSSANEERRSNTAKNFIPSYDFENDTTSADRLQTLLQHEKV